MQEVVKDYRDIIRAICGTISSCCHDNGNYRNQEKRVKPVAAKNDR